MSVLGLTNTQTNGHGQQSISSIENYSNQHNDEDDNEEVLYWSCSS